MKGYIGVTSLLSANTHVIDFLPGKVLDGVYVEREKMFFEVGKNLIFSGIHQKLNFMATLANGLEQFKNPKTKLFPLQIQNEHLSCLYEAA